MVVFGASSVAWHSDMECEVAIRKVGRVMHDRDVSLRVEREIAILQALRHENVWRIAFEAMH